MPEQDEFHSRSYPVQEDMRWQRRENTLQRIGEVILIVLVLLGACGLFSKGYLSEGHQTAPDGSVSVEYERFGRVKSNMNLTIRLPHQSKGEFSLRIGSNAMDSLQVQTLQPQPLRAVTTGSELILTFSSHDMNSAHTVWLGLQPQAAGKIPMRVGLEGREPALFSQWIYP